MDEISRTAGPAALGRMITQRGAESVLALVGLSRGQAGRVLRWGLAGDAQRTSLEPRSPVLYDEAAVGELVERPLVDGLRPA